MPFVCLEKLLGCFSVLCVIIHLYCQMLSDQFYSTCHNLRYKAGLHSYCSPKMFTNMIPTVYLFEVWVSGKTTCFSGLPHWFPRMVCSYVYLHINCPNQHYNILYSKHTVHAKIHKLYIFFFWLNVQFFLWSLCNAGPRFLSSSCWLRSSARCRRSSNPQPMPTL